MYETFDEARAELKTIITEKCNIDYLMSIVSRARALSPKYRESVYRYLKEFFYTLEYPSADIIDYSDYVGTPRLFRPYVFSELEAIEDVSEYEIRLGFSFAVGDDGMRLALVGADKRPKTICYFKLVDDWIAFGYRSHKEKSPKFEVRIRRTECAPLKSFRKSYRMLTFLSLLLKETGKLHMSLYGNSVPQMILGQTDESLVRKMEEELRKTVGDGMLMSADLKPSVQVLANYIAILNELGYNIKSVNKCYYIPPNICKADSELIIQSIRRTRIAEKRKEEIVRKFSLMSGTHRFSAYDLEECDVRRPMRLPQKVSHYPAMIYTVIRQCPIPVVYATTGTGISLQRLIEMQFGVYIGRVALYDCVGAMIEMGFPIKRKRDGVYYDNTELLLDSELEQLVNAITANSELSDTVKDRLITKLYERLPLMRY